MSRARLDSLGAGHFRVSGVLDAGTAANVLEQSEARFEQAPQIEVDLGGVGEADSAGLALLIEWLRMGKQVGKPVHFSNVPAQIEALARISEVEDLIGANTTSVAPDKSKK